MEKRVYDRLQEIHEEMNSLLDEAGKLIRLNCDRLEYERAKSYWLGHINNSLNQVNPYDDTMEKFLKNQIGDVFNISDDEFDDDEEFECD